MKEWLNPLVPFDWEAWEKDFFAGKVYMHSPYVPLGISAFDGDMGLPKKGIMTRYLNLPKEIEGV